MIQPRRAERADAARNRERILCAARRLFAEKGASCVSMDEIAEAAGVGKGTLFRRFGSRAALATARAQRGRGAAFRKRSSAASRRSARGPPPRERLIAFGEARLDLIDAHAELLAAAEVGRRAPRLSALRGEPPARHAAAARDRPGLRRGAARRDAAGGPLGGPVPLPARRARIRRWSASRTAGAGRSTDSSRRGPGSDASPSGRASVGCIGCRPTAPGEALPARRQATTSTPTRSSAVSSPGLSRARARPRAPRSRRRAGRGRARAWSAAAASGRAT